MSETANVIPIERNPKPVGTLAEAEAENLDPRSYATCSRPNPVTGVVGCPWFDKCIVSAKGTAGPRNYGIEIIKGRVHGGGFVRMNTDCMWIADNAANVERNGGSIKVVANEGDDNEIVTGIVVSKATGEPTHAADPAGIRKQRRVKVRVPAYPRPGENPVLLTDMLRAEAIEAEKERRSDESRARSYGLSHTIAPLDKRASGADGGRKAPGGGKS